MKNINSSSGVLSGIKNFFSKGVQTAMKSVKQSVFATLLGATGVVHASVSHNNNVQDYGTIEKNGKVIYVVKQDDTLSEIAQKHGLTLKTIFKNNPEFSSRRHDIYPGEEVIIHINTNPFSEEHHNSKAVLGKKEDEVSESDSNINIDTDTRRKYKVISGDTISGIAQSFGVSVAQLREVNPKIQSSDLIRVHDELIIPETTHVVEKNVLTSIELPLKGKDLTVKDYLFAYPEFGTVPTQYVREFFPEIFATGNKKLILKTFLDARKTVDQNSYLQNFTSSVEMNPEEERKLQGYLSQTRYSHLTPQKVLSGVMMVETSGGAWRGLIQQALQENNMKTQHALLKKAISNMVGSSGDTGNFQITTDWLRHEMNVQGVNMHFVSSRKELIFQVSSFLLKSVKNKSTLSQIEEGLSQIDARFSPDVGNLVVKKFNTSMEGFLSRGLTHDQAFDLLHIEYNRGGAVADKFANAMIHGKTVTLSRFSDFRKRNAQFAAADLEGRVLKEQTKQQELIAKQQDISSQLASVFDSNESNYGIQSLTGKVVDQISAKYQTLDSVQNILDQNKIYYAGSEEQTFQLSEIQGKLEVAQLKTLIEMLRLGNLENISKEQKKILSEIIKNVGTNPEKILEYLHNSLNYYTYLIKSPNSPENQIDTTRNIKIIRELIGRVEKYISLQTRYAA